MSSWSFAKEKYKGDSMGGYLLGKPSRNFVDTRVQSRNVNHLVGEEKNLSWETTPTKLVFWKWLVLKKINILLLRATLESWYLLRIKLNFFERLLNPGRGLCMCALYMLCNKNECMNLLVYAFSGYQALIPRCPVSNSFDTMKMVYKTMTSTLPPIGLKWGVLSLEE